MTMNPVATKPGCSFCGRGLHEVRKLIAGPAVFICDECVDTCCEILRESEQAPPELPSELRQRAGGGAPLGDLAPDWGPRFEGVDESCGYPAARFYSRRPLGMDLDNHHYINRDSLVEIVRRLKEEGRPAGEYERALEAVEAATEEWAWRPYGS